MPWVGRWQHWEQMSPADDDGVALHEFDFVENDWRHWATPLF